MRILAGDDGESNYNWESQVSGDCNGVEGLVFFFLLSTRFLYLVFAIFLSMRRLLEWLGNWFCTRRGQGFEFVVAFFWSSPPCEQGILSSWDLLLLANRALVFVFVPQQQPYQLFAPFVFVFLQCKSTGSWAFVFEQGCQLVSFTTQPLRHFLLSIVADNSTQSHRISSVVASDVQLSWIQIR